MSKISMQNVSVMNVQYWHYTFAYFLNSIEKCGLRNIELWTGAPHFYYGNYVSRNEWIKAAKELHKDIQSRGMQVIMLTPEQLNYPINIAGRDADYRKKSIDYFITHFELANEIGVNRVFITSGWGLLDEPREEAWKRSVDSLQILSEKAASMDITLVMEQLQPYESNLVNTCEDTQHMLAEVDSPALRCCVDVVAMAVVGDTLDDFFHKLNDKIEHIHFADGNPSGHYVWGDGVLPMMDYIKTLEINDYKGYLTLEINDFIYWDNPHQSINRTVSYMRRCIPEKH